MVCGLAAARRGVRRFHQKRSRARYPTRPTLFASHHVPPNSRQGSKQRAFLHLHRLVQRLWVLQRRYHRISRNIHDEAFILCLGGYLAQFGDCVFMSNDDGTPEETAIGQLFEDVVFAIQAGRTVAGSKEFAMFNLRHSLSASTKFRLRERGRQFDNVTG